MKSVTVGKDRVVFDEAGKRAPDGAFSVNERNPFWARLLRDGDVVDASSKGAPAAAPAAKEKAS